MQKLACILGLLLLAGSAVATLPPGQASALASALGGWPDLASYGWVSGSEADSCEQLWMGVTCDATNSTVNGLFLSGIALNGPLPSEIGDLTDLSSLQLQGCGLEGPLPDSLGSLTQLAVLNLGNNEMTGPVPTSLVGLTYMQLSDLNLAGNKLDLCGNPDLTPTSVSPGILTCTVEGQVPAPCGCPGIWTHCLTVDIGTCDAPVATPPTTTEPATPPTTTEPATPPTTTEPETVPQEIVPVVPTPGVVVEPTATPTPSIIILPPQFITPQTQTPQTQTPQTQTPQTQTPQTQQPLGTPETPGAVPTGNAPLTAPSSAATATFSTLALAILAAVVLGAN